MREGKALYDNLHPSRIIVDEKSDRAETFANLLAVGALKTNVELLFTGAREPELTEVEFYNSYVERDFSVFKKSAGIILANRLVDDLKDVMEKVFTRDLFAVN